MMPPQPAVTGQTYAVVVGISDYQALTYANGDLRYADKDARQFIQFLQSRWGGRVATSHIRLLTNRQATSANIFEALRLFRKADAGDRVILYFSGHGMPDSLVPYDAQPGDDTRLLTYRAIKAAFHASKASTKLCITDACLSGGMTQSTQSQTLAESIAREGGKTGTVAMLLASRSTESAVETGRLAGGAFTHYLLKGLYGQADLNRDKIVTIRELHRYVSPQVKQITRGKQAPVFYGRFSDDLALSHL
ncbi:putative caspase-like protein [Larkinella arboricola]|uniref:Putative caspase-like protein n=1 Tax=Larkinella arboricola TaxID=643671 RepID=A0A327WQH4_LARAB|nr:caspase family protein [Larkinella arboricola]RAJ93092.1 putative caspase-like protein [Larkinella arboricola]